MTNKQGTCATGISFPSQMHCSNWFPKNQLSWSVSYFNVLHNTGSSKRSVIQCSPRFWKCCFLCSYLVYAAELKFSTVTANTHMDAVSNEENLKKKEIAYLLSDHLFQEYIIWEYHCSKRQKTSLPRCQTARLRGRQSIMASPRWN